ncbi:MAG: LLM class F420-dependent oxidoreductase, partial [Chloroflexota bacterium]
MQIGAVFPQTEIGTDPAAIRDYAQAVEDLGYTHILAYDHVLGANTATPERQGRRWPYQAEDTFYEPLALFAYLSGVTRRIGFAAGVIILPQRQTTLVAKQAAVVDVLSGGRLRLGVGLGWNEVEYEALAENFHNRGARVTEQIAVLRALWTQPLVTFHGRWHHISDAGINPVPVQRPIPLWMGGSAERALRRIGKLADGLMIAGPASQGTEERWAVVREAAREAGRDPSALGLEGGIPVRAGGPDRWQQALETWRGIGATHVTV